MHNLIQGFDINQIDLLKAKGKVAPVGTVRWWKNSGENMKIDDEPLQRNGVNWIPVSVSPKLKSAARHIDDLGKYIMSKKEPLKGEKLMDKMLVDFYEKKMGMTKDEAKNMPEKFKAMGGFFGSSTYSFYNYFLKIDMAKKINKKLEQKEAHSHKMITAWEKAGSRGEGPPTYSAAYEPEIPLSDEEVQGLKETASEAVDVLKRGLDFEGEQKVAYDALKKASDAWPEEYQKLQVVLKEKKELWDAFDKVFDGEHDWLVKETIEAKVQEKYDKYFSKFRDRIIEDEGKRISTELKLDIAGDSPDIFYDKVDEAESTLTSDELDALLKVRFKAFTGKNLEGEWNQKNFAVVKNLELAAFDLPPGHFLNNDDLKMFKNDEYAGGHGYAYFWSVNKSITFSNDFIRNTAIGGTLTDRNEFYAVVMHEIGHAVSDKYESQIPLGYKKWTSMCGWDNRQENLKATGDAKDIPRKGRNSGIPLITEYAYKSPEESFAEYYACYANNKKAIDNWLDTGDSTHLEENTGMVTKKWSYREGGFKSFVERKVLAKGIIYRHENVPVKTVLANKAQFNFMRQAVFHQDAIAKAFVEEYGFNPFRVG